ncbi:uncharacterized protein LOC117338316 isoform X2 [Pecten maximus]|uniref:uncharacterized protein LOC117338316 isoform X2 n=1 Tax=Pecten maximus TaxID=6579 RepID=UPI001458A47B|nr:uncharacterized protein LOC117338316 isoform X2 [Pecten maximus]
MDSKLSMSDDFSTSIEEQHFRPLAASTAARQDRNPVKQTVKGGSFIDVDSSGLSTDILDVPPQEHQLRLSFSAFDQSPKLSPREVTGSRSLQSAAKVPEPFETWSGMGKFPDMKKDDLTSRNSSLGLIQVDGMSDLSSSVFTLHTSPRDDVEEVQPSISQGSQSSSQRSHSDSKNDWLRPDIDTVKKKPTVMPATAPIGEVRQSLVFSEAILGAETDADVTIPEIQFMEDELNQLDADFSYFEEVNGSSSDEETPGKKKKGCNVGDGKLDSKYLQPSSPPHSEGADGKMDPFPSLSKVTLFEDGGSAEDLVPVIVRNRDRRTEPLKTDTGDSEIDTEDELEIARKAIGQEERERSHTMGQSLEHSAGRPGLVEGADVGESSSGLKLSIMMRQSAEGDVVTSPVPGDGGGGGDGSSGSDSEDQFRRRSSQAQEFLEQFRPSFQPAQENINRHDLEEQRVRPMGDDLLTEKGLNRYSSYQGTRPQSDEALLESRFLSSQPTTDMTTVAPWSGLDNSTFVLDELLQSQAANTGGSNSQGTPEQSPGDRLEASGFNADDAKQDQPKGEDPFGGLASSFGSFGASPVPERGRESTESSVWKEMHASPLSQRTSNNSRAPGSPREQSIGDGEQPSFGKFDPPGEPAASKRTVYQDEDGEFVTDLAYQSSFVNEVNFQKDKMAAQGLDVETPCGLTFTDQEFFNSDVGQNMLDADEQEFQKENVFMQEEVFTPSNVPVLEESWALHSKMSLSCPSSLRGSDDYTRISVGTFMKSRSGALGSIDGVPEQRPEFGMICKTPPENRKPVALLDIAASGFDGDESSINRTAGVGNEEGDGTLINQSEMTLADLALSLKTNTCGESGNTLSQQELPSGNTLSQQELPSDQSASESSTTLNISEISRAIANMSKSAKPEELAKMIMSLSSKSKGPISNGTEKMPSSIREETEGHSVSKSLDKGLVGSTERKETEGEAQRTPRDQLNKSISRLPVRKGSNVDSKRRSQSSSDSARGSYEGEEFRQDEVRDHVRSSQEVHFRAGKNLQKSKPDGEESEDEFVRTRGSGVSKGDRVSDLDEGVASLPSDIQGEKDTWRSPRLSIAPSSRRSGPQQEASILSPQNLFGTQTLLTTLDGKAPQLPEEGPAVSSDIPISVRDIQYRDKQPADGQASKMELYVQTSHNSPLGQSPLSSNGRPQSNTYLGKKQDQIQEHHVSLALEKSPRSSSSTSLGLTGHHIPDGTEYSFQADVSNVSNRGRSREDLVGTADIQLADSRGFDLINNRELYQNNQNYKKQSTHLDLGMSQNEKGAMLEDKGMYSDRNSDLFLQSKFGLQKNQETADISDELVDIPPDSFTRTTDMVSSFSHSTERQTSNPLFIDRICDSDRPNITNDRHPPTSTWSSSRGENESERHPSSASRSSSRGENESDRPDITNDRHPPSASRSSSRGVNESERHPSSSSRSSSRGVNESERHPSSASRSSSRGENESERHPSSSSRSSSRGENESERHPSSSSRSNCEGVRDTYRQNVTADRYPPSPTRSSSEKVRERPDIADRLGPQVMRPSSRGLSDPVKDQSEWPERMTSSPEPKRNHLDTIAMPPPPLPSFRHDLLSRKPVASGGGAEKPLLLTSQSLSTTSFAQEYLHRDIPGHLITNPLASRDSRLHGEARVSAIPRPHFAGPHSDDVCHPHLHQQTLHGLSTLDHGPAYQSTPFSKGNNSTLYLPIHDLIMTPSSMHTMMSTGPLEESLPIHSTYQKCDKGSSSHPDTDETSKPIASRKLEPVDAPSVLEFSSVCCVGISSKALLPMTNPTMRWLECHLEVDSLTLDGHPVSCDANFPFEMKSKVIIEPHNTEDMSVIFIPKFPGAYKAHLNIYSHSFLRDKDAEVNKVVTSITILAEAEKPQIQVVAEGHRHLDFGHLSWGSTSERALCIVNEGKAMVPIRLAITTNKRPWHCFAFDQKNSAADVSVISRSSRPQTQALGKTVITMCLPGRRNGQPNEPREIIIYCRPPDKHCDRAMAQLPPDEMTARVDVEVDTPSSHLPALFSIKLTAVVGVTKLRIARNLDVVQLMAPVGRQASQVVTLKNAGNINMELMLLTADFADAFIVTPKRVIIPPGDNAEACIKFLPTNDAVPEFQTVLLMRILPDGPDYEVPVLGKLVKEQVATKIPLLSDKHFVCFGGVPVGQVVQKKVTLWNKSEVLCRVRVEIRSSSWDFQLQGSFNSEQKEMSTRARDVIIKPMEKYPIHIVFAPSSVCESTGKLVLKYSMSTFKFSIPFCGYGGTSSVILERAKVSDKDHYWLDMGEMSVGQRLVKNVILRNTGDRPAYVQSLCCTDLRCKQALIPSRVLVDPDKFVLGVQESRTVMIILNPTHRESALCLTHKDLVGVVTFLYGDEISRQKMRGAIEQGRQSKPLKTTEDGLLKTISFCNYYMDEESVEYTPSDQKIGSPQTEVDLFYSSMQRLMVSLVGEPQKSAVESMTVTPPMYRASRTADLQEPSYSSTCVVPVKDTVQTRDSVSMRHTMPVIPARPLYSETDQDSWGLQPDKIILNVPNNRDEKLQIQKFVITNFLNRKMAYELCWPGHWIKLTPEKGTVEPKSSSSVCLSPSAAVFQSFDQLPWSGKIHVNCDNQYKVLLVQIRNDLILDGSTLVNNNTLVPLSNMSATLSTPLAICGSHDPPTGLHTSTTTITFPPTNVGEQSVSCIDLTNYSKNTVKWILSSFAPPYVKGADNSRDVFRATYKVFEFAEKYGQVAGRTDAKLQVQFIPRSKGMFSQHWDIQSNDASENSKKLHTVRVQLCGEGSERSSLPVNRVREVIQDTSSVTPTQKYSRIPDTSKSTSTAGKVSPTKESRNRCGTSQRFDKEMKPVVLKDRSSDIHFPSCGAKATVVCKVHLKNESKTIHSVEIKQPSLPFKISHTNISIRPRSYLRLPVEFSPQNTGHYTESLVFKVDVGYSLTIRLEGHCT